MNGLHLMRGLALGACVSLFVTSSGCVSSHGRAASQRESFKEGMGKPEVLAAFGRPHETFRARGPRLGGDFLVETWCYTYRISPFLKWTVYVLLFPIGFLLVDNERYGFDVGFDGDDRARQVGPVMTRP